MHKPFDYLNSNMKSFQNNFEFFVFSTLFCVRSWVDPSFETARTPKRPIEDTCYILHLFLPLLFFVNRKEQDE